MQRLTRWLIPAFALAACSPGGDKGTERGAQDTTSAVAPTAAAAMAIATVLYNTPKDTAAFEKYYNGTHLPLLKANQKEIGHVRADFTRFTSTADGKKPSFYRQAELYFNSMDDLRKGISSPGFKKVADDLQNFASGGLTAMIATASNDHGTSGDPPGAIVTVIYKTPKDTAAFEKYYSETHLPLVTTGKNEIGFERAEFTKFDSNLDGSKADRYRQAELYFSSTDVLKKGTTTAAFKKVAGDLPNFATGGLDALIGVETR